MNKLSLENYSVDRPQIEKVRYTHDAMIDLLVMNPGISQNALANHFGYSASWISTIMASDAFQVRLSSRRTELLDPVMTVTIEEKFRALAEVSVKKLMEHLEKPTEMIDPEILLKAAALGAKTMGLGTSRKQEEKECRDEDSRLKELAGKLTGLLSEKRNQGVIDVEAKEIIPPASK